MRGDVLRYRFLDQKRQASPFALVGDVAAYGGPGNDEIRSVGMGGNQLRGGPGDDYVQSYSGGSLAGGIGDDTLHGSGNTDLRGGPGDDQLHAFLEGRATAGNPDGWLEPATAELRGGQGADTFAVRMVGDAHASSAIIHGFRPELGDRLDLSAFVMGEYAGGSAFYFSREIFAALDVTADGRLDAGDGGAVSLDANGSLTVTAFGDRLLLEHGPQSLDAWMLA